MTEPRPAWYKRDILPPWLPGWLAGSALIGVGFAVMFGLFLDDPNPLRVAAVAGVLGFGMGLVIFSWASLKTGSTPEGRGFVPPAVIRWPIVTALVALVPFFWMTEGRIATSVSRGGRTLLEGIVVEGMALAALVLIVAVVGWRVRETWRRTRRMAVAEVLSLTVAVSVLGSGLAVVVTRHVR